MKTKYFAIMMALALASCASPQGTKPPVAGPFERADADRNMELDYGEFRNYMAYKASPYPEEQAQLAREAAMGNGPMHKRFLMLDQNNDGAISYLELGGG